MSDFFNFKDFVRYGTVLEDAEIDTDALIDSIYVGPQGELLELVDRFNLDYNCDLGITRQFTLKPGGYDKLKKAYANSVLRWDMKPKGINSIFKRINDWQWMSRNFRRSAEAIEAKMKDLRTTGLRWQDNTDDFKQELTKLKSIINKGLTSAKEMYPQYKIEAKLIPVVKRDRNSRRVYGGRTTTPCIIEASNEYIVMISLELINPEMTVHILHANNETTRHKIPMDNILCCSGMYLLPTISRMWGKDDLLATVNEYNREPYFLEAAYLSTYDNHPYIKYSTDNYAHESGDATMTSHLCTGNMGPEIQSTLYNLQIEAHIMHLVNWLTNYYVPHTNPLNQVWRLKQYGKPIHYKDINSDAFEVSTPNSCSLHVKILDNIKDYGKGSVIMNAYGSRRATFDESDVEYRIRTGEYINSIEIKDLPCVECEFVDECKMKDNIVLLLKDEAYTPMEEAYIGMFHELHDIMTTGHIKIFYTEELVQHSWCLKIDENYDAFLLANIVADYATDIGAPNRYQQITRGVYNKPIKDIEALIKFGDSLKEWTIDAILNYETPKTSADKKKFPNLETLESIYQDVNEVLNVEEEVELTPEEQVMRWATLNGGAINL